MTMTHTCEDKMSTALCSLMHLLCKDEKIHKKYHQVVHDGLGNGYIALYNLCRFMSLPCLKDVNLMANAIQKQKAT